MEATIIASIALLLSVYGAFFKNGKQPKCDCRNELKALDHEGIALNQKINELSDIMKNHPIVVIDTKGRYSLVHKGVVIKEYLQ